MECTCRGGYTDRLRLNERWVLSNNNGKGKSSLSASAGGIKLTGVTGREDNERERKRMLEEVGGTEKVV